MQELGQFQAVLSTINMDFTYVNLVAGRPVDSVLFILLVMSLGTVDCYFLSANL